MKTGQSQNIKPTAALFDFTILVITKSRDHNIECLQTASGIPSIHINDVHDQFMYNSATIVLKTEYDL